MYGFAAKRFDRDIYKNRRWLRNADFALGFLTALLAWLLFFRIVWWFAPMMVFAACMAGILAKIKRRYLIYGALSLVFFPLIAWATLMIAWAAFSQFSSEPTYLSLSGSRMPTRAR